MILSDKKYFNEPYYGFFRINYKGGLIILFSIILSIVTVNTGMSKYFYRFVELPFKIGFGNILIDHSFKSWVNNFIMPFFFFLMGLALKRELIFLNNNLKKSIPLMITISLFLFLPLIFIKTFFKKFIISEILYLLATDIILVMFVLNIFSAKINSEIKSYILSFSIIINTILMILIIRDHNREFNFYYFLMALSVFVYLIFFNIIKIKLTIIYLILAFIIIFLFYIAGLNLSSISLLVAFIIPVNRKIRIKNFYNLINENMKFFSSRDEKKVFLTNDQIIAIDRMKIALDKVQGPLQYIEHSLHNLVVYLILPIFVFINLGFSLDFGKNLSFVNIFILNFFVLLIKSLAFWLSIQFIKFLKLENPFPDNILFNISISFISSINLILAIFLLINTNSNVLIITTSKISILICCLIAIFLGVIFLFFSKKLENKY